jgi:steroid delta-isomerase-like uncharacterized protein
MTPIALVNAWFDMCRTGDDARLAELATDDYRCHGPGGSGSREGFLGWLHWYPSAFADQRYTVEDVFAAGDRVVARYTVRSTYRGGFLDLPASGKPVHETGIIIFRLLGGKVAESWYEGNDLQIAQQLGGVVTPAASTA